MIESSDSSVVPTKIPSLNLSMTCDFFLVDGERETHYQPATRPSFINTQNIQSNCQLQRLQATSWASKSASGSQVCLSSMSHEVLLTASGCTFRSGPPSLSSPTSRPSPSHLSLPLAASSVISSAKRLICLWSLHDRSMFAQLQLFTAECYLDLFHFFQFSGRPQLALSSMAFFHHHVFFLQNKSRTAIVRKPWSSVRPPSPPAQKAYRVVCGLRTLNCHQSRTRLLAFSISSFTSQISILASFYFLKVRPETLSSHVTSVSISCKYFLLVQFVKPLPPAGTFHSLAAPCLTCLFYKRSTPKHLSVISTFSSWRLPSEDHVARMPTR